MLGKPEVLAAVTERPRFLPWEFHTITVICFFKKASFFSGFSEPLGGSETDLREADVSNHSRLDQGPQGFAVGRQEKQGTTENVDGVRRHAC